MVDTARALLDELMGRNRDLDPSVKLKKLNWDDPQFCQYYLVKFCPHDLFVNTRADLGQCPKLHDDEAKRMYEGARPGARKRRYEEDFLRFCNNMINEVDRKIQKGRQRLLLMNKGEVGGPLYVSKFQEHLNNLNARIKKLLNEAEEAGHRGDVDQAQGLMMLCEQLKEEKEALVRQHGNAVSTASSAAPPNSPTSTGTKSPSLTGSPVHSISAITMTTTTSITNGVPSWASDLNTSQEKQMEVCEVCGAFLIVGDAQQRIEDHLTGKQHLGYSRLRKAVEEMHDKKQRERDEEDRRRDDDRKKLENGNEKNRRDRDRERDQRRQRDTDDHQRKTYSRDFDRRGKDRSYREKEHRHSDSDRRARDHDRDHYNRGRDHRRRSRSRSHSRR